MRINTKQVVVSVPPNMYEALKKLAEEQDRTVSGYVRWVLWRHMDEKNLNIRLNIRPDCENSPLTQGEKGHTIITHKAKTGNSTPQRDVRERAAGESPPKP